LSTRPPAGHERGRKKTGIEARLRKALARDAELNRQQRDLIQRQALLSKESDHRFLNGLQMVISLLSLQSRASSDPEIASQLAVAANRVSTIERVHRRLHCLDERQTVAFKQYLEELCREVSAMVSSKEHPEHVIVVEGTEVTMPSVTAIPLSFVVNELITNAAKYGKGRITVRLEKVPEGAYALSVSNEGPGLPEGFDPAACKGLGMKIVRSLVEVIGGELRFGRGDNDQGTRFTVLFK
jgi:two-component sensor histidine kinase